MIHTKIHHLLEGLRTRAPEMRDGLATMLADAYAVSPHYVLSDELLDVMSDKEVMGTVRALMDAGVCRLPYKHCLVELNQTTTLGIKGRAFVWFSEEPAENEWLTHMTFMYPEGKVVCMDKGAKVKLLEPNVADTKWMQPEDIERLPDAPFVFEIQPTRHSLDYTIVASLGILLTITHTRGAVKEVVTAEHLKKLNKARISRGRQEVLPYTVFKIGHTYSSKGERTAWAPGCKMKPHLRAGHTRRQRYGTGRNESKLIFIEPVLVNCESIDEVQFKPKVVTTCRMKYCSNTSAPTSGTSTC